MITIQSFSFLLEPLIDRLWRSQALGNITSFILQVKDHSISNCFVELIGMDVGTKNLTSGLLVLPQQGCTSETDENVICQPSLHLLVHIAALGAVAFINKNIEASLNRWRIACEIGIEFMDEGA